MSHAMAMMNAYPKTIKNDRELFALCIQACLDCTQACTACADACLSEDAVASLAKCVRTNLDCSDICLTTANVLSRHTGYDANITAALVEACAQSCRSCADECGRHASKHDHCRICAEACRECERKCGELLSAIAAAV